MVIRGSHGLWVLKDIITFERCNIFFLQLFFLACFNFPSVIHVGFLGQLLYNPGAVSPFVRFVWTHEKTAITVGCKPNQLDRVLVDKEFSNRARSFIWTQIMVWMRYDHSCSQTILWNLNSKKKKKDKMMCSVYEICKTLLLMKKTQVKLTVGLRVWRSARI